jgi:hypothetical protein
MYYSIHTKYLAATNTRGSRIKATLDRDSVVIPYPYDSTGGNCHREAVETLLAKLRAERPDGFYWNKPFVSGELPDGSWAHVFVD